MGNQDVFKGALGWDDWIWWTGIGGVGLFILLTLLCCCVCVQRAKRKGRQEALATVQARQREQQQREEAQVRYAQAQQARYPSPAQEQQYKYSQQQGGAAAGAPAQFVPAGQKKNYGPQVKANAYAMPPAQQYDQQQYGQQQYGGHQQYGGQPYGHHQQQQQQYGQYTPSPQQQQYGQYTPSPQQQQYAAIPKKQPMQQQYYDQQQAPSPSPAPQQYQKPYAKPKPWHTPAAQVAPPPPAYPESVAYSSGLSNDGTGLHDHDAPFVAVTSPIGRDPALNASTVSVGKMTLRDRIDALREGSVHENHSRISADAEDLEPQPIGGGRRSLVIAGTVLSEQSPSSSSSSSSKSRTKNPQQDADGPRPMFQKSPNQVTFEEQAAFKTARSEYSSSSEPDSAVASVSYSTGQFDDADSVRVPPTATYQQSTNASAASRPRVKSNESSSSRGSVEF